MLFSQGGYFSNSFVISNGMKQGCVLALVLFNLIFTCMLTHTARNLGHGVYLRYRLDVPLFDLRPLRAKTKNLERIILEASFADDHALKAHKESDLQLIMDKFAEASGLFGLTINLGDTEVLLQPASGLTALSPSISIEGTTLKRVKSSSTLEALSPVMPCLTKRSVPGFAKPIKPFGACVHKY